MGFLIAIIGCIVGVYIGAAFGSDSGAALGFFGGLAIGIAFARMRNLARSIDTLRGELESLRRERSVAAAVARNQHSETATPSASSPIAAAPTFESSSAPATRSTPATPAVAAPPPRATDTLPSFEFDAATTAPPLPTPRIPGPRAPLPPQQPSVVDHIAQWVKRWFTEGNVPVKVGVLVLFAGVAALLKYASDQGWLSVPIELRLAGIALAAIAALVFGWRERTQRRAFSLSLQGGAIGALLLTVYAAFRLYHLMPAGATFALLLVFVAGAGALAVLQDALALAVLGILAGFAAPILISTGSGDHVVLFSYYALLNLAIFAIAWVRAWRALNLLGFFFTYAIGTAWGVLRYDHALFASTEPFLIIYFAIYLAVPILYARRQEPQRRDFVDGTLVFGNPLVAFALQAALLQERLPLAYSALALAAVYVVLAWWQMPRRRVLGESFAVLAIGFATLAVPLALSARSTSCTFALEGAALIWLGLRQQRLLPQVSGLVLQLLAAIAFIYAQAFAGVETYAWPIANGTCISALLIAASAFASAWLYRRSATQAALSLMLYLWGLAWWLGAGLHEIDRYVPNTLRPQALLAFAALCAALAAFAAQRTRATAPAWTSALALAFGVLLVGVFGSADARPFAGWGLAAFAAYALLGYYALYVLRERTDLALRVAHFGWLWTWTCALALALYQISGDLQLGDGWRAALTLAPVLAAWSLALLRPTVIAPPLSARFAEQRVVLMFSQATIAVLAFVMLLWHDGSSAPLPYFPIVNPVELAQIGVLACFARWLQDDAAPREFSSQRSLLLAAGGFLFVTAATLRATHQLGGVPWDAGLWSSNLAQTALTVVWSVLGVFGWVLGSRRGQRMLWLGGALLMGVVLAKLLLVDRGHLGNLFGIASFIAYGLLCTVIGYFAPAPPRAQVQESSP